MISLYQTGALTHLSKTGVGQVLLMAATLAALLAFTIGTWAAIAWALMHVATLL